MGEKFEHPKSKPQEDIFLGRRSYKYDLPDRFKVEISGCLELRCSKDYVYFDQLKSDQY